MNRHHLHAPLALLMLVTAGGATCCPWPRRSVDEPAPIVFEKPPAAEELVRAINANSEPIRQLHADNARIAVTGYPALRASIAVELPQRFRLKAELLTSSELDLGSNEEVFWIWGKHQPGALLYARHDQYLQSAARELVPMDPQWLIEALGVVQLDPRSEFVGPIPRGGGDLELQVHSPKRDGEQLTRLLVIDGSYGWILEQHLKDARGNLLATVEASDHRYYPELGLSLPDEVRVHIAPGQPNQFSFRLTVDGYTINQLGEAPPELWALPQIEGYELVDLSNPRLVPPEVRARIAPANLRLPPPRSSFRPEFRGYSRR